MWAFADKADWLITLHIPQSHDACFTVAGENVRIWTWWWLL
jgi:hypothetical protein